MYDSENSISKVRQKGPLLEDYAFIQHMQYIPSPGSESSELKTQTDSGNLKHCRSADPHAVA